MPTAPVTRPLPQRPLLFALGALLALALGLTLYAFWAGNEHTLPVGTVAQLQSVPLTLDRLPAGADTLALQANGYLVTQNYDVAGPELWPAAATLWLLGLGLGLTVWLAVVSQQARPAFLAGTALVIFLLMGLSLDTLQVFSGQHQYFLMLTLAVLLLPAFLLQAFFERVGLGWRLLLFATLLAVLATVLFVRTPLPAAQALLQLAAYATLPGLAALALLSVWLGGELIYGLLWLNTQGASPRGRFGLMPFVVSSLLLLGIMGLYYWNGGQLAVLPGVQLEPYLLLLAAAIIGWWTLPRRQITYQSWLALPAAAPLYLVLVLLATGGVAYAAATLNTPLLQAGRSLSNLILLAIGVTFFGYVLVNFAPLIRDKKQVHRVAYDPRRMPLFAMYAAGILIVFGVLLRNKFDLLDLGQAGQFIQLGDLTRAQSEQQPDNLYLAALAERYYAEADQLDPRNARAALGRAALYQAHAQRQNEINILRTTLLREPNEKVLLRLNARFDQPADFFARQLLLWQALRSFPASPRLNAEMAQLYARSTLVDSVQHYYRRALAAETDNPVAQTNWLAFLLKNNQQKAARAAVQETALGSWPAWQSNAWVLDLQQGRFPAVAAQKPAYDSLLNPAQFAQLYHVGLAQAARHDTTLVPLTRQLRLLRGNEAFADQLAFLGGLQLLRSPRPAAGFDELAALATGSTADYYQQVLGLYLVQRGLYPAAAAHLSQTNQVIVPAPTLPAVYALYWAGRPDSGRVAAQRLLYARQARRESALANTGLLGLLRNQVPPPPQPLRLYAKEYAALSSSTDAKAAARQYRRLIAADPFDEAGALQAAGFFGRNRDLLTAYEMLQRATSYNPESVPLLKAQVLTAADAGLDQYATDALSKLGTLLPSAEYITFRSQYDKRRAIHQAAVAPWN